MSLKTKRLYLRLGLHSTALAFLLIIILLGALVGKGSTSGFFAFLFIGYLLTLRVNPLPRLLEVRCIQEHQCSTCGENIDLVGGWSCGCGFTTWEPRHALAPCPVCKKEFDWLQCPSCDNGILT